MPDGYTIPRVEVTEQIATSPFSACAENILKATELYKFLVQKHCFDFLSEQYLHRNITPAVSLQMALDLETLTRNTPYLVGTDDSNIVRTGDIGVRIYDRVI